MKKIIYITVTSLMMITSAVSAYANRKCDGDWKQKMMSEKIAFLTIEMGITPEEAQVFWPVYNQMDEKWDKAMKNVFRTFRALEEASKSGKNENELSRLLNDYFNALKEQCELEEAAYQEYKKVLPTEKLVKLYIGEEKFRRQHIRNLHGGRNKPEKSR